MICKANLVEPYKKNKKNWTYVLFRFRRVVFQGDPYSPIISLVSFNPLIQYLKSFEDKYGYQLGITDGGTTLCSLTWWRVSRSVSYYTFVLAVSVGNIDLHFM